MELHKEPILGNLPSAAGLIGFLALYMQGTAPKNADELKAAIDIYDFLDVYNKSLGVAHYAMLSANSGQVVGANLTQVAARVALKKGVFDYNIPSTVHPAGTAKAPLPDRIFACETVAPFSRLDTRALGMASIYAANMAPWLTMDGSNVPLYPGKSIGQPHLGTTTCQEFEWDTARTLTGVIRPTSYGIYSIANQVIVVEAWNGSDWDTVLPSNSKTSSITSFTYHAFSTPVTTTKLRVRWSASVNNDRNYAYPHGIVPVEQSDTAPAPVQVPDIGWAVLVPMYGRILPAPAVDSVRFNKANAPVPMYVCSVGGPGDGAEFDLILSKNTQLSSSDMPGMTGVRLNGANITE